MEQPYNPLMNILNSATQAQPQPPVMPFVTPTEQPQYVAPAIAPAPQTVAPVVTYANLTAADVAPALTPIVGVPVPDAMFNSAVNNGGGIPFATNAPVAVPMPMPSFEVPSPVAPVYVEPAPVQAAPAVAQPIAPVVAAAPVVTPPAPVVEVPVVMVVTPVQAPVTPVVQAPVQQAVPLFVAATVVEEKPKATRSRKPAAQQNTSVELVKQDNERGVLEYSPRFSMDQMLTAAKVMIESGLCPKNINAPEQVVMIMKMGSEIGLNTMAALNNIHSIQGRPTLGVHAIAGQLKKYGVTYNVVSDFLPMYDATGSVCDYITVIEFVDTVALTAFKKELLEIKDLPADIRQLYIAALDKTKGTIFHSQAFKWSEAQSMELTGKDNWKKMPRQMCSTRCLTLGGRFFKPEALMGYLETSEAAEVFNVQHSIDEEGEVTILN
jgi:hypothetical protein